MNEPPPLSDKERTDLVAYLDGELGGAAARALEAKLSLNPAARAEAEALRRTWDLLDFLPKPEPSPRFTERTLSRVTPVVTSAAGPWPLFWPRWRRPLLGLAWAAGLVLAALAGYAGAVRLVPREPGDKDLVRDLRVIENKRLYEMVGDIDFLKDLDQPDLFGDEPSGS